MQCKQKTTTCLPLDVVTSSLDHFHVVCRGCRLLSLLLWFSVLVVDIYIYKCSINVRSIVLLEMQCTNTNNESPVQLMCVCVWYGLLCNNNEMHTDFRTHTYTYVRTAAKPLRKKGEKVRQHAFDDEKKKKTIHFVLHLLQLIAKKTHTHFAQIWLRLLCLCLSVRMCVCEHRYTVTSHVVHSQNMHKCTQRHITAM